MNSLKTTLAALAVALLALGATAARAQDDAAPLVAADTVDECSTRLASAEVRYAEQDFPEVEALLGTCLYADSLSLETTVAAHRLVALAFLRRDLLPDAQATVLKLLARAFFYEPDEVRDPPLYVALVRSVKQQLTVRSAGGAATAPQRPPVSLNGATAAELEALDGIGPATAARIVAYRESYGPFRSVDDLEAVPGIGPRTMERLRPQLVLGTVSGHGGAMPDWRRGESEVAVPQVSEVQLSRPAADARPTVARVNVNTATAAELDTLDGIGPVLAGRIIEYREANGPFRSVDELDNVSGIGPRTLERLAPYVTVGDD